MVLKSYIFSYVSGEYLQFTSDHSETFIKQSCLDCTDIHQIAIHRDGNLMYYIYLHKPADNHIYGLAVVCGEICTDLKWLFESLREILEASANKGALFTYNDQGQICRTDSPFSTEAAEVDYFFQGIKNYLESDSSFWEVLPPEDLTVPLNSKITFAFNEDDGIKITEGIRHYHNVVVTMDNTSPSSYSQTIARLNLEKRDLHVQNDSLRGELVKLSLQKKQYKLVVALTLLVASGIVAIYSFNRDVKNLRTGLEIRNNKIDSLNTVVTNQNETISLKEQSLSRVCNERDQLETDLNGVKSILENISENTPIIITNAEVKNGGENYGDQIYSNSTTFIYTKLTIYSLIEGDATFFVKFYAPYGLSEGNTSPSGYSFSDEHKLSKFQEQTVYLSGWGNKVKGNWRSGSYRIEIWFKDKFLYEKKFTIN